MGEAFELATPVRRTSKSLTAAFVRNVSQPGKYHDGGGLVLYLRVESNGSRFLVQRITIRGKRCELGLGTPPLVARAECWLCKSLLFLCSSF